MKNSKVLVTVLSHVSVYMLIIFLLAARSEPPTSSQDVVAGSRPSAWVSVADTNGNPVAVNLGNVQLCWADTTNPKCTVVESVAGRIFLLNIKYSDFWKMIGRAAGK